ncbi:MAG: alpha/beta hydrolase [Beijerinckiaceae bacterium]
MACVAALWHYGAMELVATPDNPIPGQARPGTIVTPDGLRLRYAAWRPTVRRLAGTVLLIHGRSEFIEKYFEVVAAFRRRGFHVVAIDLRGQGGSDRMLSDPGKGHVDDFMDYVVDIDTVVEQVMAGLPRPHFAVAHSMGAASLLLSLDRGADQFDRVILMSPLAGLAMLKFDGVARAAAAALDFVALGTRYVPGGGPTPLSSKPFPDNRLTSDPVRYARVANILAAAPQLGIGDPTVRWTQAMFQTFDRFAARDFGRRIVTPSLMLIAGADPLCSAPAAEALALRLRGCQPVVIPGAKHEIFFERDDIRDKVFAAIDAFIPGETRPEDLVEAAEEEA